MHRYLGELALKDQASSGSL